MAGGASIARKRPANSSSSLRPGLDHLKLSQPRFPIPPAYAMVYPLQALHRVLGFLDAASDGNQRDPHVNVKQNDVLPTKNTKTQQLAFKELPMDEACDYVMDLIHKPTLSAEEARTVMRDVVDAWSDHVNPGFLAYRKSVADGGAYACIEWRDNHDDPHGATLLDAEGEGSRRPRFTVPGRRSERPSPQHSDQRPSPQHSSRAAPRYAAATSASPRATEISCSSCTNFLLRPYTHPSPPSLPFSPPSLLSACPRFRQ